MAGNGVTSGEGTHPQRQPGLGEDVRIVEVDAQEVASLADAVPQGVAVKVEGLRGLLHCPRCLKNATSASRTSELASTANLSISCATSVRPRSRGSANSPGPSAPSVRNARDRIEPTDSIATSSETTAATAGSAARSSCSSSAIIRRPSGTRNHAVVRSTPTARAPNTSRSTARTRSALSRPRTATMLTSRDGNGVPVSPASRRAASTRPRSTRIATQRRVAPLADSRALPAKRIEAEQGGSGQHDSSLRGLQLTRRARRQVPDHATLRGQRKHHDHVVRHPERRRRVRTGNLQPQGLGAERLDLLNQPRG